MLIDLNRDFFLFFRRLFRAINGLWLALLLVILGFTLERLVWGGYKGLELIVCMDEGISESIEGEEGGLQVSMEVDGGVVRDERGTKIHKPSHFLLL
jgi:hypothetical protein